jgi:hypothetical protein
MTRPQIIQLKAITDDAIEFRQLREDETRWGNALAGAGTGASIVGGTGAVLSAVFRPSQIKRDIDQHKATMKIYGAYNPLSQMLPKRTNTKIARRELARLVKASRIISQGGWRGRGLAAAIGAAGYGATGALIGAGAGALQRPRKAEELNYSTPISEINNALKDVIEFRRYEEDDEERHPIRNAALTAGGIGALGAGALYLRGRNMPGPVQPGFRGVGQTMAKGYQGFRADAQYAGNKILGAYDATKNWATGNYQTAADKVAAARGNLGQTFQRAQKGFYAGKRLAGGGFKGFVRGARSFGRIMTGGRLRWLGLSAAENGVVELNAMVRDALEFRSAE